MAGTTCSLYFFRKLSIVLNLESSILYLELNVEFRILYSIPASRYKIQDSHYTSDWHFLQILNFLLSAILSKPFSFTSFAAGPNTLPPFGKLPSPKITTALSSKRIYEPSCLLNSLRCLIITAFTTSCFFTNFLGSAFFTVPTTISPN